jgi:hypothetical protein
MPSGTESSTDTPSWLAKINLYAGMSEVIIARSPAKERRYHKKHQLVQIFWHDGIITLRATTRSSLTVDGCGRKDVGWKPVMQAWNSVR